MTSGRSLDSDPIEEARRQWIAHGWGSAADGMAAVTSIVRAQQIVLQRIDTVLRPLTSHSPASRSSPCCRSPSTEHFP